MGASDDVIDLYERHALQWDEDRGLERFEQPWLDRLRALLAPGASVLDVGCGGGRPIATYLLGAGLAVTGVDTSARLVGLCRARLPRGEWLVGDMRRLSLGRRFDGIVAWHSLFHLPPAGQREALARFDEHAGPGAVLLFTSGPAAGESLGQYRGEPLYHASLDPDEYRALLYGHGFDVIAHCVEDPACGGATVWLARRAPIADRRSASIDG
jgi:SAM-dependent methyltransferase